MSDGFERARAVADAVLYEGYVLYPYRASAAKNQLRWQFGVLAPRSNAEAEGAEQWVIQTECLLEASLEAEVDVKVRCLQVQERRVERAVGEGFEPVASLDVDDRSWSTWDEALEHEIDLVGVALHSGGCDLDFALPAGEEIELIHGPDGVVAGRVVRMRQAVGGVVRVTWHPYEGPFSLVKLGVRIENLTDWRGEGAPRDEVMRRSLVAVHTVIMANDSQFISLFDPPEFARAALGECQNIGTWPVLMGEEGDRDVVLSSPIILYDHPQIAPESPGDFHDGTEIDEILALRVMTLTEEEKRQARGTDARAAAIVDRCDNLPPEVFERLHGAVRYLKGVGPAVANGQDQVEPWWDPGNDAAVDPFTDTLVLGPHVVGRGARVKLCPGRRADAQDLFLAGRTALVQGVFQDVDGNAHLAVLLEDDPAAELHQWHGRYLYFHPDEVEVLA